MKFSAWLSRCALAILLCACVNGCLPPSQSQLDDEKEPHFIEGKRAVNTMDYNGAIDEFEKAVEASPRNASAHFELGWLYEEKEPDPAGAIYHYQQFLKLRPTADTADAVRQRILNCKQDLAKTVLLQSTPGVQHDLEQLIQENKQLRAEVDQWRAYFKAQPTNHPVPQASTSLPPVEPAQNVPSVPVQPLPRTVPPNPGNSPHMAPRSPGSRTYVVQSRDTFAAISRKFNVRLDALTAANPGIDPRKLRSGQTVNIP
jgi:tetratricopeptide (TPR) repeat protein